MSHMCAQDIEGGQVNEAYDNSSEISGEFGDNVSLSSKIPVAADVSLSF